jgi:hypothetical protein
MSEISFQDIKRAYAMSAKAAPTQTTLCYSGKPVVVRPLKMRDKKEFLKVLEKDDDVLIDTCIDSLIEKYVADDNDNPVTAASLVDQERHQLLMLIRRASTTQESVEISHVCPQCKTNTRNIVFDLKNVIVNNFKKPDGLTDMIVSKNDSIKFTVGILTRGETVEIEKFIQSKSFDTKVEKEFVYLASTVKEIYLVVDDIEKKVLPSIAERVEFVESLSFDDFDKIKKYFDSTGPYGLLLQFAFDCPTCKYKNDKEEAKIVSFFIN